MERRTITKYWKYDAAQNPVQWRFVVLKGEACHTIFRVIQ